MSRADRDRWDEKHRATSGTRAEPASTCAWIPRASPGKALALDLACGSGRNIEPLLHLGYHVIATDVSRVVLTRVCANLAVASGRVVAVQADCDHWVFRPSAFDLVFQVSFLDRRLVPEVQRSIRPGGLYLLDTFAGESDPSRPGPMDTAYRLQPGELRRWFDGWTVIRSQEDYSAGGRAAILAAKPEESRKSR